MKPRPDANAHFWLILTLTASVLIGPLSLFTSLFASLSPSLPVLGAGAVAQDAAQSGSSEQTGQPSADVPVAGAAATATEPASEETLRNNQLSISGRFARFERMLSQMADILGREDPERADLLRRAISKGREQRVNERIENIVKLMESREFGSVLEEQQNVTDGLIVLLKLLQSEDRRSSVEKERERLNELLRDVRNLITEQRSARSAAQNATAPSSAAPQQKQALDKTGRMLDDIQKNDASKAAEQSAGDAQAEDSSSKFPSDESQSKGEPKSSDSQQGDPLSTDPDSKSDPESKTPPDSEKADRPAEGAEPSQSDPSTPPDPSSKDRSPQPKDRKPGDQQSPTESPSQSPSESDPQQSESQSQSGGQSSPQGQSPPKSSQEKSPQTPGREQLEQARKWMQEALEQLQKQQRDPALQRQDKALAELHEAAAELEKMLRQLREEEKEMLLATLEARFQRMLAVQTQIQEGTLELAATPLNEWLDQYYGRCKDLARQQSELTTECSQTASLLREDGTSVSILMAVEDIETDMESVAGYLRDSQVGPLTQSVERDIIESLKELIETTQKEMEEMKSQQRQEQQDQNSQDKPPLVELMAEIRVLRSLQMRVNRRTRQVDDLIQQTPRDERSRLTQQVTELSLRQQRLMESAGELARQLKKD